MQGLIENWQEAFKDIRLKILYKNKDKYICSLKGENIPVNFINGKGIKLKAGDIVLVDIVKITKSISAFLKNVEYKKPVYVDELKDGFYYSIYGKLYSDAQQSIIKGKTKSFKLNYKLNYSNVYIICDNVKVSNDMIYITKRSRVFINANDNKKLN